MHVGGSKDGNIMRGVKHDFVRVSMHPERLTPILEPANIPRQAAASTRKLGRIGRGTRGFDGLAVGHGSGDEMRVVARG